MKQIDGLVTKDEIYRLISNFRTRFKISEEAAHEMAKRVAEMPTVEAEPVDRWISVKDRLPDKSQRVLAFYKALGEKNRIHDDVMATNWRTNKGDFIPCDGYKVTHWQPLPDPPKEDNDGKD